MDSEQEGISIAIFESQENGRPCVGLVLEHVPLVEYEGHIVPGCVMTPDQARRVADALLKTAKAISKR